MSFILNLRPIKFINDGYGSNDTPEKKILWLSVVFIVLPVIFWLYALVNKVNENPDFSYFAAVYVTILFAILGIWSIILYWYSNGTTKHKKEGLKKLSFGIASSIILLALLPILITLFVLNLLSGSKTKSEKRHVLLQFSSLIYSAVATSTLSFLAFSFALYNIEHLGSYSVGKILVLLTILLWIGANELIGMLCFREIKPDDDAYKKNLENYRWLYKIAILALLLLTTLAKNTIDDTSFVNEWLAINKNYKLLDVIEGSLTMFSTIIVVVEAIKFKKTKDLKLEKTN